MRLELARNYFLVGKDKESKAEFIEVLKQELPSQVEENILFHLRAIEARKPFKLDFSWAYLPESSYKYETYGVCCL